MFDNVWLIPLFPLIGFLINGLFGKKIKNEALIGGIGTLAIFGSFIVSCGMPPPVSPTLNHRPSPWLPVDIRIRPPRVLACMALRIRLTSTCSI